jgi:hypothetical protein
MVARVKALELVTPGGMRLEAASRLMDLCIQ